MLTQMRLFGDRENLLQILLSLGCDAGGFPRRGRLLAWELYDGVVYNLETGNTQDVTVKCVRVAIRILLRVKGQQQLNRDT